MNDHLPSSAKQFTAIFIDYENIYYHLSDRYADIPDLNDFVLDLLRNLKTRLEEKQGLTPIIMKAYADFERLKSAPQGSLYLMGVETHNVLGTEHKNAADMRLCIDVLEVMYTRPEIETFILFAGDRDYIPVIQHLRKQARRVLTVAFRGNISGDLLLNVGQENFIDAQELFIPERLQRLEDAARREREIQAAIEERNRQRQEELEQEARAKEEIVAPVVQVPVSIEPEKSQKLTQQVRARHHEEAKQNAFHKAEPIVAPNEVTCLKVLLQNYGNFPEIWMSPFLRKLSDALPFLADFERKSLVNSLENFGAIAIEKRHGEPFDYTVIRLNYNHPTVRELFGD